MSRKELQTTGDGLLDAASDNERGHQDATWNTYRVQAGPKTSYPTWVFVEENALQQQPSGGKYN